MIRSRCLRFASILVGLPGQRPSRALVRGTKLRERRSPCCLNNQSPPPPEVLQLGWQVMLRDDRPTGQGLDMLPHKRVFAQLWAWSSGRSNL